MNNRLITELQKLLHYHGPHTFYTSLEQAGLQASAETEDISKDLSEKHQMCAHCITELIKDIGNE